MEEKKYYFFLPIISKRVRDVFLLLKAVLTKKKKTIPLKLPLKINVIQFITSIKFTDRFRAKNPFCF